MSSVGFPDTLRFARLSSNLAEIQERSARLRSELVSGRVSDVNRALGARAGDAHLIRKAIDDAVDAASASQRAQSRASASQLVLAQIGADASEIGPDATSAIGLSDEAKLVVSGERARAALSDAFAQLNQRYEGRSLFAGDAVDSPALNDVDVLLADVAAIIDSAPDVASAQVNLDTYFNDPAGGFETSIYLGGLGDGPEVELFDGSRVQYSVRANDQSLKDLLRSYAELAVSASRPPSPDRNTLANDAATRLIGADAGLAQTRATLGVAEERLAQSVEIYEAEQGALSGTYNDRTAIDSFETATELRQLENQLEAAFVLTARIASLSLTNFLR
ncbi:MAG: hypothetical protein AAGJ73_07125 [Pseudomonadota bacterium]